MRPSKFTEEQMVRALREVTDGTPAVQVCRALGITQTTFYRWRNKFGAEAQGELREMRQLREENLKLKQLVAELLLDKQATPAVRRRPSLRG